MALTPSQTQPAAGPSNVIPEVTSDGNGSYDIMVEGVFLKRARAVPKLAVDHFTTYNPPPLADRNAKHRRPFRGLLLGQSGNGPGGQLRQVSRKGPIA